MPDFLAWLYSTNGGGLAFTVALSVLAVTLGVVALVALKRQARSDALARREAGRAVSIEEREKQRATNLAKILEVSNGINATLDLEPLLNQIVDAVSQSMGFRMALLRILDEESRCFVARAFAGLDEDAVCKLSSSTIPIETFRTWMKDEFKVSQSYFISHKHGFWNDREDEVYIPDLGERAQHEWHPRDSLFVPLWTRDQHLVGYLSVDDPVDRRIPSVETIETLEIFANQAVTAIENARLYGRLEDHVVQLRDMTRRLKELNEIKSNFVATVSHELRTPLTSIRAYAETLARDWGTAPRETEVEFLRIIEDEAQRLSKIVEDMLDLSRMESGKVEVRKSEVDLRGLMKNVAQILAPTARKKYVDLRGAQEGPPIIALVDGCMMKQLLLNLIGNAIKFTPEGGKVTMGIEDLESTVEISVEDTGIGIPASSLKRIFDQFYQVDSSATRRYGGVGLGLAIVKSIVEWHEGMIWAESDGGNGARFTVRLPKRKAVTAEPACVPHENEPWHCECRVPELIVDMIAELMGAKTASLMLLDKEAQELHVAAAMGLDEAVMKSIRVRMGEGVSGFVAKTGEPILVRDIEEDERFKPAGRAQYETKSLLSVPVRVDGEVVGVINVTNKISLVPFTADDAGMLQSLADRVSAIMGKVRHYEGLKSEFGTITNSLRCLIESRRLVSSKRGEEITGLVVELARGMGLSEEDVRLLQYVSAIYDVGMVRVGEGILRRRGGLRVGEYESVKRHPEEGVSIVGPIEFLEQVKEIILHHHERFDGNGYPDALRGSSIPMGARILAVVDAYGSMLSDRPYRAALSMKRAVEELRRCSGTQFDPAVVAKLVEILEKRKAESRPVLEPVRRR
jgi:signal transduction histidine kinase/HD-GYP domain-containing protein (c-di-GMP phosphodiesterase class II)